MRQVTQCPVCDAPLQVSELSCTACDTCLRGRFPPPPLARLPAEQQRFIETFLLCRGIIRDVERALGISYPTVRARLDAAVTALETAIQDESETERDQRRRNLLQDVEAGRLEPEAAAKALRAL